MAHISIMEVVNTRINGCERAAVLNYQQLQLVDVVEDRWYAGSDGGGQSQAAAGDRKRALTAAGDGHAIERNPTQVNTPKVGDLFT